jgi:probable O-glycosylation ligase (exosortase A-associated)
MAISISFYGLKSGVGSILTSGTATVYGPANTVIADNNHFAVALLVTVPLLNYLRMNSKMRIVQVGCSVMIALCVISVFASYSRGGLLGLFAMSAFLWLKSRAKIMPAVALGIALFTGFYFMPQRWIDRMNTIETYSEDESAQSRLGMWHAAMAIASQRPFGAGFMGPYNQGVVNDYYPGIQARAVHSIYFEVIGEHGYIVFFFWALVPLFAWRNGGWIIKYTRDRPDLKWAGDLARMIQVSLIGYCVGGTFLSLSYWDFYFTLVAVLAATRMLVATAVRPMTVPRLAIQREQHLQAPAHLPVTDQIQRS